MTRRLLLLALAPFTIAGLSLVALGGVAAPTSLTRVIAPLGYLLATLATAWAAAAFGMRDRMGRAWALNSVGSAVGMLNVLAFGAAFHGVAMTHTELVLRVLVSIFINATSSVAVVLFARVWADTGLRPAWRGLASAASVTIAVLIVGRGTVADVSALVGGQLGGLGSLFSDLGDIFSISLLGPIFATAVAMRGGYLVWMWALLVSSNFTWLFFDACAQLAPNARLYTDFGFSLLAHLLLAAAAMAHVLIIRSVRRDVVSP